MKNRTFAMPPIFRFARLLLAGLCASLMLTPAQAKLVEMADGELSEVTGQAFLSLSTDSNAGINYTRLNLGINVDTQLNINKLQLGQYDDNLTRPGELAGSSDILINNFALGTVNADDSINPFKIANPFVELAYQGSKVVGVRIGFGEAKGTLSGDIQSLSGSIPVHIEGTAKPIYDAASFERFLLPIAGVFPGTKLQTDAVLVNASGAVDPSRSGLAGMANGQSLDCVSGGGCLFGFLTDGLLGLFKSNGCQVLTLATCFPLSNFQSLPVGNMGVSDAANTAAIEGAAKGFFISMQTQDVAWRDLDSNAFMTALKGAYLNLPKSRDANGNLVAPITIDFEQAFNGTPRQDTCLGSATKGC